MTGDASNSLKLIIRLSSSSRFEIGSCGSIKPGSTIRQVKELISQREESGRCAAERQRLIHKGRILSDDSRTLADYGIGSGDSSSGEGIVLYLVKGGGGGNASAPSAGAAAADATMSAPASAASLPNPNASLSSNPFANFGNANAANNPMASMMNMMGNSGGMPDLASIQQQFQQNPQMMSDMMNNPMVQSLMSSPDFLRTMMESNPQMRQVMESNPELRHALEDPEFMRRSMQMMRDPSAMQNMMRNQDLAMSQIENMPGGYNALRRMYEDVQEPMIDALAGGGSAGTTGSGSGGNAAQGRAGGGTAGATNQAMPNPWGSSAPTPTNQAAGGGGANPFASLMGGQSAGGVGANPFASLMGSTGGMGMPGAGAGAANNPWANPMMGPNAPNLEATLQMMENPMMQQMMQNMMSNPETMRMMMESNPMVQQLRQTNPQAAAIFDNPEMMRAMMDPSNLRSMVQMQQAMQQLSGSMPGMMGIPASPAPAGGLDFSNLLGTSGTRSGITAAAPMVNPFMFPLMPPAASGDGGPAAVIGGSAAQPAPGQRFRQQLQSLQDMGFTDRSANIRALSSAHGNVNRAIEILLESPPEMADSSEVAATDETGDDVGAVSQGDNDGAGASSMPKDSSEKKND